MKFNPICARPETVTLHEVILAKRRTDHVRISKMVKSTGLKDFPKTCLNDYIYRDDMVVNVRISRISVYLHNIAFCSPVG